MKKYQIVTWNKESGFDEKLDFDTVKQAKENINLYTDYDYIYIIDTKTLQIIYSKSDENFEIAGDNIKKNCKQPYYSIIE